MSSTLAARVEATHSSPTRAGSALRAELRRARQGRQLVSLFVGAIALCLLTSYSLAAAARTTPTDAVALTETQARAWMMTFLLAGIFGSMLFTRDVRTGALARSVLLSGRRAVLTAKIVVAASAGLAYGIGAAVMAYLTTRGINTALGVPFHWTGRATQVLLGVIVCCVLAAVFGLFVGILLRSGSVTLLVLLLQTLLVEPGVQRLWPEGAKYFFTIALSSVYLDVLPGLLDFWAGLAVALGWVAGLGVLASRSFLRRDLAAS